MLVGMYLPYLICSILWIVSGFLWFSNPAFAARLAALPVGCIAVLCAAPLLYHPYRQHLEWSPIFWFYGSQALCIIIALALVVMAIRNTSFQTFKPFIISFGVILVGFVVDQAFVGRTDVRSYSMNWTSDGTAPWGPIDFDRKNGPPIILYRQSGTGYCFDLIYSSELRQRLIESNEPLAKVEYGVTSDFGRERGYNIRSVNGLIFVDRHNRQVRSGQGPGGYWSGGNAGLASCEHR